MTPAHITFDALCQQLGVTTRTQRRHLLDEVLRLGIAWRLYDSRQAPVLCYADAAERLREARQAKAREAVPVGGTHDYFKGV